MIWEIVFLYFFLCNPFVFIILSSLFLICLCPKYHILATKSTLILLMYWLVFSSGTDHCLPFVPVLVSASSSSPVVRLIPLESTYRGNYQWCRVIHSGNKTTVSVGSAIWSSDHMKCFHVFYANCAHCSIMYTLWKFDQRSPFHS